MEQLKIRWILTNLPGPSLWVLRVTASHVGADRRSFTTWIITDTYMTFRKKLWPHKKKCDIFIAALHAFSIMVNVSGSDFSIKTINKKYVLCKSMTYLFQQSHMRETYPQKKLLLFPFENKWELCTRKLDLAKSLLFYKTIRPQSELVTPT